MGSAIGVVLLFGVWWLWRHRAGRRQADAQERIAGVLAPLPPPGRYPKPSKLHSAVVFDGISLGRICHDCRRITGDLVGPADQQVLLVDLCWSCAVHSQRLVG